MYYTARGKRKTLGRFADRETAEFTVRELAKTDRRYSGLKVRRLDDDEIRKSLTRKVLKEQKGAEAIKVTLEPPARREWFPIIRTTIRPNRFPPREVVHRR